MVQSNPPIQPSAMVTGSTGFIGRRLVPRLQTEGWHVTTWQDDIRSIASFEETVEVVFHLAAVTRHDCFITDPYDCYDVNVTGTLAVLNYCQKTAAKCVFTSTSGVYQSSPNGNLLTEEATIQPALSYGLSKLLAENLCRQQAEHLMVPSVILRLFNVYGPGQHPSFFVPYIIDCLQQKHPISLRMPHALRDFVYVDDVVDALIGAANFRESAFRIFNIGSGQATKVIDFVRLAEQIYGQAALEIKTIGSHPGEVPTAIANIERARQELKWVPQHNVRAGLAAMESFS